MGTLDRVIRIAVAAIVALLYFTHSISGGVAVVAGIFAIIFVLTSFISFCPLYVPFKISTRRKQNN